MDHLNEKLSQLMGRQNVVVPEAVLEKVQGSLRAAGKADGEVDGILVRSHMKKLRLGRYYELANTIANKISKNKATVRMHHTLEEDLRKWFLKIQAPFEKHKGAKRKSFLNYNYTLYQLLSLVPNTDHMTKQLVMLKSKARLREHDTIWEKICNDVGLDFVPYVKQ